MDEAQHPTTYLTELDPDLYLALHTGSQGDVAFYRGLVERWKEEWGTPPVVLELGCGGGRILTSLVEAGGLVTGVDLHEGLLSRCAEQVMEMKLEDVERVTLRRSDFTRLKERTFPEAPQGFDLIFLPYNGLYCVLDKEAQISLIRDVLTLLSPHGQFWLDGYALPDPDEYLYDSEEEFSPLTVLELEGKGHARIIGVEEQDSFDLSAQRCDIAYRYLAPPEEMEREPLHGHIEVIRHRFIYPWDLPEMATQARAHTLTVRGGFSDPPLSIDSLRSLAWGEELDVWVASLSNEPSQHAVH